jgi:hypothetical protein
LDASKEVGLDVNTQETKCMVVYRHQNSGQNFNLVTDYKDKGKSKGKVVPVVQLSITS